MSDIKFVNRNIKALAILGLWEYGDMKNPILKYLFNIYGKIIYVFFIFFNITEFIDMYYIGFDILPLMSNAAVSLLYAVNVLKAYSMHFRKVEVKNLLSIVRRGENNTKGSIMGEIKIYEDCLSHNTFVTKLFWYVCASTIGLFYIARPAEFFLMGPQEMHGFKVPFVFSSWFPFDKFAPGYYDLAYVIQVIAGLIGASYVAIIDMFLVSFMIYAVAQLRILQHKIKYLHLIPESNEKNYLDKYDHVIDIIKEHNIIIKFVADLDAFLNLIVSTNFLTCSLLICSISLEGVMAGLSPRLGLNIYYLMAILIEVFLFYWHANEISLESLNIGRAVSESQWYNFSPRVKKALLMMMVRSQKPCILSIGGFYIMSLNTYLMILRTTYSFVALFRKMYERQTTN